jgi:hypothetical protein
MPLPRDMTEARCKFADHYVVSRARRSIHYKGTAMAEIRGVMTRIGAREGDMIVNTNNNSAVGHVRVAGKISVIQIGDVTLRNVGCNTDIYDLLDLNRDAILFVHYHYWRNPVVLGVKYPDDGKKYLMGFGTLFASVLAYLIFYPIFAIIAGFIVGLMGGSKGGIMSTLGVLIIFAGFGLAIANAVILVKVYMSAKAR